MTKVLDKGQLEALFVSELQMTASTAVSNRPKVFWTCLPSIYKISCKTMANQKKLKAG